MTHGCWALGPSSNAKAEDDEQVLLLGDSISIEYTLHVRGLLSRVADVHRPPANCESTLLGLKELDHWLGNGKWDIIHFNCGSHDLKLVKTNGGRDFRSSRFDS